MNTKLATAFLIAFGIGFFCRKFSIDLPAPNTLTGVGLILAITAGYLVADRITK